MPKNQHELKRRAYNSVGTNQDGNTINRAAKNANHSKGGSRTRSLANFHNNVIVPLKKRLKNA